MAFTTKEFNDLRGILFLMLLTIPSIATTNIDCNGKPFHCVNSTHFMICVDLGFGVSSTIDSFIIPCPAPTECRSTNRYECEFPAATTQPTTNKPLPITTDQTTIATVQAIESTVQSVPEIITTVPFEDFYNTVSAKTLSGNEPSTTNPTFITDSTIINVIDNVNVSTSGNHADLEVGGSTNVLNITSSTQTVFSETTMSPVITDATVANTTEKAIQQTDSNLNPINKIPTTNLSETTVYPVLTDATVANTTENAIKQSDSNLITINKIPTKNLSETTVSPVITDATVANTTENAIQQTDSKLNTVNEITTTNLSETTVSPVITDATVANTTENAIQQTDSNLNTINKIPTKNLSETTVSPVITDATVANTTENAIQQTDSKLNTVNEITTTNLSESTVSPVITDATVANTTENAIQQTDSKLNTINEITTTNLDIAITMTEYITSTFTTTEKVNLITENKIENEINRISEKNLVIKNINATSSIQNQAEYTTESLRINDAQDQLKRDTTKETTVTITNPLEDVLINVENKTTTLTGLGVSVDHTVTGADTEPTTQIYATTATSAAASSIIPSDLSVPTESIILVESNTFIENKVLVDQEKQLYPADRGTTEKPLDSIPKTIIEVTTQDATLTADYNLGNVAISTINDSDIMTGPSSELHNAVISSTASTIDTTLIAETTTQYAFNSIRNTGVIPISEVDAVTGIGITYDDNNNRVDSISTISIPSSDSFTLTTDAKMVSTESTTSEKQNKTANQFMETKLITLSENLLTQVTTEKKLEFIPSVTEPAISDSNINLGSNVDTQSSKLDTVSQQLEVPNIPNSDNKVSDLNSQNNILGNIEDNKIQDIKTKIKITTEPSFAKTDINTNDYDINTRIQLIEHNYITLQPDDETSKTKTIQTTDGSNVIVSDGNNMFEPSSPVFPTEPILYLDDLTPEKATKDQIIIESTPADDNQSNSPNNTKNNSNTNTVPSNLPTEATALYYKVTESNKKLHQLYTVSETNKITDTTNKKGPNFDMDKIISEIRKTESKGQETLSTPQNEQTKTQLQEKIEINSLQNTATETIVYLPTIAGDGRIVSIESIIFEKEPNKFKQTVADTTSSENQLTLATTASILDLNPTVTDSVVSNLFFETSVNVQSPKALFPKTIELINKHNLNMPEISLEKSSKVESNGYEIPMTPTSEIQTQLGELEFNTQQQKETKSISGITRSMAGHDAISKLTVTESTRNVVDFNVLSQTVLPDSVLQLSSSSVLENTEKSNLASLVSDSIVPTTKNIVDNNPDTISKLPGTESEQNVVNFNVPSGAVSFDSILQLLLTTSPVLEKTEKSNSGFIVLDSIVPTTKSIVNNSPDYINNKYYNTKHYGTGVSPTISILENLDNKVQDHAIQKMASPENQIVIPLVNSLGTMQYNPDNKLPKEITVLQTSVDQITTESKFASQNINENPQDKTQNIINTAANTVQNLEPNVLNKLSLNTESVNKPNDQEINVPILENTLIHLTPSSAIEIQKIEPDAFGVVTDTIANSTIHHKVKPEVVLESSNKNNKDQVPIITIGIPKNGPTLPELSSTGDFSTQNAYINKHIIIEQRDPHKKESIPKELNNAVINEEKRTSDVRNHISISDAKNNFISTESATESGLKNISTDEFNNTISTENSSKVGIFNESNPTASTPVGKNQGQNSAIRNNTILSEAEPVQSRKNVESHSIGGFVKTVLTKTSDVSNTSAQKPMSKSIDQNSPVGNNTNLSEAETVKSRNKLESNSSRFVKTVPIKTSNIKILPITTDKISTEVTNNVNKEKGPTFNSKGVFTATQALKSPQTVSSDNIVSKFPTKDGNNGTENTHSSIVFGKKNLKEEVKSLAERDVSTTSNKLSTTRVESTSGNSPKMNNNADEAVNLAPFDLLSSAKSSGFEEKNNKPSTEKPDDEETIASGNSKINNNSSFTTLSSTSASVTTESVESDNDGNNNIVQSNIKYETLTSKPPIEISARSTQVDNLKNIQLPIVAEVSTQSTVRSTTPQKLTLENNTPLPATTKAITTNFVCKFNQRGRFADKHDCRKFYICHGIPQPLEGICPYYTVFSELRKQCTKNLSHCVRNNQFQCMSEGRFSDVLNDNIYYICAKNKLSTFIRFKLLCQNGYHLNKTSVRCVLNTESVQSISSDISKSNSEQSAALKVEVESKDSKKEFECKKEGTFADPDNCRVYFVCKKKSKSGYRRKKKKCDSDEYFHKDTKKCVDAESYECK